MIFKWLVRLWIVWTLVVVVAICIEEVPALPEQGKGATEGLLLIHAPMPAHGPSNDPWPDCNNSFSRPENYPPHAILRCPKRI